MTTNKKTKPISNPDRGRTNPEYWEQILESYGLGEKDLGLAAEVDSEKDYNGEDILDHIPCKHVTDDSEDPTDDDN